MRLGLGDKLNYTRELGQTGVNIPVIGFGTWRYSGGVTPLRTAIDKGAKFIDTAETYGSEEVVGEAIHGCRKEVFLATKVRPANFRKQDVIRAAEGSLKRLRTDYLDLYQLHWPNYSIPIAETMSGMEMLIQSGKIRFVGVSNFSVKEISAAQNALGKYRIVANQVKYSLIERSIEDGLLQYCQENKITIIAFSPLGATYSVLNEHDPTGVLPALTAKYGKSHAQLALNWLIEKNGVVAIPKASTPEHVIEDCGAAGWHLPETDYSLLTHKISYYRRTSLERFGRRRLRWAVQKLGRSL